MENSEGSLSALTSKFGTGPIYTWKQRCRPRILVLCDGNNYVVGSAFGLTRFLYAITLGPGVPVKPILTLAHRTVHSPGTVTLGPDTYTIVNNFNFATAATPVTLANYDQIWIFGFGAGTFALSNPEVGVVSTFMNGGGGVFATGDHADIGRRLSGSLPRIRHMREWRDAASGGVGMGLEADVNLQVMRIDTIVDPGANNTYDFADQSDGIPQRIYPNYRVIDTDTPPLSGNTWSATVHPVLMLPGASVVRTNNTHFKFDLDVLPDHPHESVCYEVTDPLVLGGQYNIHGQNFAEWNNATSGPSQVRAEIVAYGVSGGRSVLNGGWKPPVRPRMFGLISAYDGRLAVAYPSNTQPPGRILCESTWHHYVNINIDGSGTALTALGTGTGAGFVPGPHLLKIYGYWNNMVTWLQPANRFWCSIYWELAEARFDAALYEELMDPGAIRTWSAFVALGRQARQVSAMRQGAGYVRDHLLGFIGTERGFEPARDVLLAADPAVVSAESPPKPDAFLRDELLDGLYGALLVRVAELLPDDGDPDATAEAVAAGPSEYVETLREALLRGVHMCAEDQAQRLERGRAMVEALYGVS